MRDAIIFIQIAQRHGFSSRAAHEAFDGIDKKLAIQQHSTNTVFYIYRTEGKGGQGDSGGGDRLRLLLAFPSADGALAFAQRRRLASTPRLSRLSVAQLLTILIHQPTISTIIFVDESVEGMSGQHLPPGLRLDRTTLLAMLQGG